MLLVVCFLFLIALASLLGTFPIDPLPPEIKSSQIANSLIAFTRFSGGREFYGSFFFTFLLGALGLWVSWTISSRIRRRRSQPVPVVFSPVSSLRLSPSQTQNVKSRLEKAFASFGYRESPSGSNIKIEGSKNIWGELGPLGVHLGLVMVLLAGLATLWGADVRETEVREGGVLTLPKEKRELRLDKFIVFRHAASGRPSQYTSRFWIKGENGRGRHMDLSVNHPLYIGRTKIFQMRYRVEIPRAEILVYKNGEPAERVLLETGKPQLLSAKGPTLLYDEVVPDFKLTKNGIFSAGSSYERSAMRLKVREQGSGEKTVWIFPDAFGPHGGSGRERQFSVLKLHKVHTSGVRISYDPGLFLAYPGLILLIFSSFCSSFAIPRRLRLLWSEEGPGEIEVKVEGWCPRDPGGLKEEVHRLMKRLS